jgi:hypothetical protein
MSSGHDPVLTHAGSLYLNCPFSTDSPIIFSHQFYEKDELEESFSIPYILCDHVWASTLVGYEALALPSAGASTFSLLPTSFGGVGGLEEF